MMTEHETGLLMGILIGEGSFGGDGRQPEIVIRMHVRHEKLLHHLLRIVPGSRLYGPYHHAGRNYFQWMVRGDALRKLLPTLDAHLTEDLDDHVYGRYQRMKAAYLPQLSAPAPRRGSRGESGRAGRSLQSGERPRGTQPSRRTLGSHVAIEPAVGVPPPTAGATERPGQ